MHKSREIILVAMAVAIFCGTPIASAVDTMADFHGTWVNPQPSLNAIKKGAAAYRLAVMECNTAAGSCTVTIQDVGPGAAITTTYYASYEVDGNLRKFTMTYTKPPTAVGTDVKPQIPLNKTFSTQYSFKKGKESFEMGGAIWEKISGGDLAFCQDLISKGTGGRLRQGERAIEENQLPYDPERDNFRSYPNRAPDAARGPKFPSYPEAGDTALSEDQMMAKMAELMGLLQNVGDDSESAGKAIEELYNLLLSQDMDPTQRQMLESLQEMIKQQRLND